MKKPLLIAGLSACLLLPLSAAASLATYPLQHAPIDLSDKASLQRGAKYVVNYCMGCHALEHLRYNRLGRDLGLSDELVEQNLIFTRDAKGEPTKVGELMTIAMSKNYGKEAFGVAPPDLTLVARSRGADWIYTYLQTFYLDEKKQWGVNNAIFPDVAMPHVLWELQGLQSPLYTDETDANGNVRNVLAGFEQVVPGTITPEEYDQVVLDITNFLTYAAEPAKLVRYKVGAWVLFFLTILAAITYLLKKEYWRDIK
jgi:ubiquinol-cytochrome c reductase cytochrome c1 subunit